MALRILGVDPGSLFTGWGCIESKDRHLHPIEYGHIALQAKDPFEKRLLDLHQNLSSILERCRPKIIAVERAFFAKNASSALKLGQVRGVVLLSVAQFGAELREYSATEVKRSIGGYGHSEKDQITARIKLLLGSQLECRRHDESDALALAITAAYQASSPIAAKLAKGRSRSMARSLGFD